MMGTIFSVIGSVLTTGFNRWAETKQAKHKASIAKIEASAKIEEIKAQHTANWEVEQAKNSRFSWKDEWLVLMMSAVIIACFIPFFQPFVSQGFAFLNTLPAWFQASWLIAVGASFGVRIIPAMFGGK